MPVFYQKILILEKVDSFWPTHATAKNFEIIKGIDFE